MKLEFFDGISWYSVASENFVNTRVFDINSNTSGQLNINRLSGYPANSSFYLRGDGVWATPASSGTVTSVNIAVGSGLTVSGSPITTNGTITIAISSIAINQIAGYSAAPTDTFVRGDNSWSKIYTSIINFDTDLTSSGKNINAQTGTLIANNLAAYNSGVIVCGNALSVQDSGTYKPYNGSYGYLNSSGTTGQATGQNPYSINCTNRVKASEFNAVSSKKIKTILGRGEEIEHTAIELFKKIPLFKYKYKDVVKEGNADHYGIIAEELAEVIPAFVNMDDKEWIPNIYTNSKVTKESDNLYKLHFNKKLENIETKRLKLIFQDQDTEKHTEVTIVEMRDKKLIVFCKEDLPKSVFVYGTYEICPTVAKQKVFELGTVVLKSLLRRIETLEQKFEAYP